MGVEGASRQRRLSSLYEPFDPRFRLLVVAVRAVRPRFGGAVAFLTVGR
jgi:hypothetical protein